MAIQSRKNLYGNAINAHLHSIFQNKGGWRGFHTTLLTETGRNLQIVLNDMYGERYAVDVEESMQIQDEQESPPKRRYYLPDASIREMSSGAGFVGEAVLEEAPILTIPALETIPESEYYAALSIRTIENDELGESITWLELLSPANKVGGSGYSEYTKKRAVAIANRKSLVEFDFLHETTSPIEGVPSYPHRENGATPYSIAVTDMRDLPDTSLRDQTRVYGFFVDAPIRTITVPLKGTDSVMFNMMDSYNRTYESFLSFSRRVDYEKFPPNFDSYSIDDQERIIRRRRAIIESFKFTTEEQS
jgi:hypothetical protein